MKLPATGERERDGERAHGRERTGESARERAHKRAQKRERERCGVRVELTCGCARHQPSETISSVHGDMASIEDRNHFKLGVSHRGALQTPPTSILYSLNISHLFSSLFPSGRFGSRGYWSVVVLSFFCTHGYAHTHQCPHTHNHLHTHALTLVHTHTRTHTHTHTHTHKHIYSHRDIEEQVQVC